MKKTMKKKLVMLLVFVFVIGIAGIAMADENPFSDVPQGHWAYAAVGQLAAAGLIDGYGDGTFRGDHLMTRYEMAQLVAKAMARSDEASADNKALIDKLAVEFADELNNLGVRVTKLEDKTKIGLSYESFIGFSGDSHKAIDEQGSNAFNFRQRIYFNGQVNDQTTYGARLVTNNIKFGSGNSSNNTLSFDRMYFTFNNVLFDQTTIGRFGTQGITNGLLMGSQGNNDGIKFSSALGDNAKFTGLYVDVKPYVYNNVHNINGSNEIGLANIDFKLGDVSGLNLAYETAHLSSFTGWPYVTDTSAYSLKTRSYDVGAYTQMGNVYLTGEYVKTQFRESNAPDVKAWGVQLSNGVSPAFYPTYDFIVDPTKAHSDAFALSYRKIDNDALPLTSAFNGSVAAINGTSGLVTNFNLAPDNDVQGFGFIYQNVLSKGVIFTAGYQDLKAVSNDNLKDKVYDASFQFVF